MATKRIQVDELRTGMFISSLDVSWIKSPFFRHKRLITKIDDIVLLKRAGVKNVVIDLDKGSDVEANFKVEKVPEERCASPISNPEIYKSTQEFSQTSTSLNDELVSAVNVKRDVVRVVGEIGRMVDNGLAIRADGVIPIIDKAMSSLARNNQALFTLLHQSRKDSKLSAHTFGVFTLTLFLAKECQCSPEEAENLGIAAMLHDSGWSKLPGNLFSKGRRYSDAERQLAQQHLSILEKLLSSSEVISDTVRTIILQHHELGDGSGYPKGLLLEQIHPLARILTVCDTYDELIHGIGERPGMIASNAISDVYQLSKKGLLDLQVASTLAKSLGVYPLGSAVLLNTGEKAVVVEVNSEFPLLPVVKICYEKNGRLIQRPELVRLSEQTELEPRKIHSVIDPTDRKDDPAGRLTLDLELTHGEDF